MEVTKSKRQQKAEEKELQEFSFQTQNFAKRVLKAEAKKRVEQAARARLLSHKQQNAGSRKKRKINTKTTNERAEDEHKPKQVMQMPPLSPRTGTAQRIEKSISKHTSSLPALSIRTTSDVGDDVIAKIKKKLADSPLAAESKASKAKQNLKATKNIALDRAEKGERERQERMKRKAQLVKIIPDKKSQKKFIKIRGHYAPGSVGSRPEHIVPRRLALSAWLDPEKMTALEKGLSTSAMKAMAPENELQGPINWSSADLRIKYRDEKVRTKAWQASTERETEAERLRIEEGVFIPVVTVSRHPVHLDFDNQVEEENMEASKRSRLRNRMKMFSYDLPTIWSVNRPENPELLLAANSAEGHEGEDDSYPPRFKGVNGLENRRDVLAHESHNCQIQSITPERALEGAIKYADTINDTSSEYIDSVQAKIAAVTKSRTTGTTIAVERASALHIFSKRIAEQKAQIGNAPWLASKPILQFMLRVETDGQIVESKTRTNEDTQNFTTEQFVESILLSVYKYSALDSNDVLPKVQGDRWRILGYLFNDQCEYEMDIEDEKMQAMLITRRAILHAEQTQRDRLYEERLRVAREQREGEIQKAQRLFRAQWWYSISLAASATKYKDIGDNYATLAGYSEDEARFCVNDVQTLLLDNQLGAKFCSVVHRQAIKVPIVEERTATGGYVFCAVIAAVGAVKEDSPDTTSIVLHVRKLLDDVPSFALSMSIGALRKWMIEARLGNIGEDISASILHQEHAEDLLPPTSLKWWLLESDWKCELFRGLLGQLRIENNGGRLFIPGLAIAQAGLQYENMRLLAKKAGEAYPEPLVMPSMLPSPDTLPDVELIKGILSSSEDNGGLGIVECLWEVRRLRIAAARRQARRKGNNPESLDVSNETGCLALQICGRKPGDKNYIGCDPPSMTLHGRFGLVPSLFVRDAEISSTNSVTCVVSFALDQPILCPVVIGFDNINLSADKALEFLDLPTDHWPVTIPPFVLRNVISKLDFRESCTIMALNGAAALEDIGEPDTFDSAPIGHRRFDPEVTPQLFRVRFTALISDFLCPDPVVNPVIFGITQAAATLNAPDTWAHRYTWHMDTHIREALTRQREAYDYAYITTRGSTVGSNDPNGYQSAMTIEVCTALLRRPRRMLLKEQHEFEEKLQNYEKDKALRERLEAARISNAHAEEQRALLAQEINDKRLIRERELRGKSSLREGRGARSADWLQRRMNPSTKKLGKWKRWQAYLFLDNQARKIIVDAMEQADKDQLARIAAGERPKTEKEVAEETFNLAVKEGTLFYHEELEDIYTWDQPEGWQGVATLPTDEDKSIGESRQSSRESSRRGAIIATPKEGNERELSEEEIALTSDYEANKLRIKKENELREMRVKDSTAALKAAKDVEHARRIRFIEGNARNWLDERLLYLGSQGATDLRLPFKEMDTDGSGLISYDEFRIGLADLGLEFPEEDQTTLIHHLDPEENAVIDYILFIDWLLETRPDSYYEWSESSRTCPELGPNTWAQMRERDKLIATIALVEQYRDYEMSGQYYYFCLETLEFTWIMPDKMYIKKTQDRSARELRQAQGAASLAAKAAVESAEQAERAAERSMERIVGQLKNSSDFVRMVAKEMGMTGLLLDKKEPEENSGTQETEGKMPKLKLKRRKTVRNMDEISEGEESYDEESSEEEEEEEEESLPQHLLTGQPLDDGSKPGLEWRVLKPGRLVDGFITKAMTPNTRGIDLTVYASNLNKPGLVGVVDPADVSHIPFEDFPPMETKFIEDIMEDTMRADNTNVDMLLDKSDEEEMLEMIQDAFLAVKSLNIEKLEELMDLGVKITEADDKGNTLLLIAAQQGSRRLAKLLLRRGADINAQNLVGNTSLHFCFQYGFNDLAEYLISKGADDSLLNKDGLTCYEGLNSEIVEAI